jgi:O-antigen ligase
MNLTRLSARLIPAFCLLVTITFTPFLNRDPVNPLRIILIAVLGAILFGVILISYKSFKNKYRLVFFLLLLPLDLILVYFFSGANRIEQLYGAIGRNYGLITQVSLMITCIASFIYSTKDFINRFSKTIILASGINMAYGTLQVMGLDPVKNWSIWKGLPIGFFGNPNQYSSFTAIAASVAFCKILISGRDMSEQAGSVIFILFSILSLFFADSTQGWVILTVGIVISISIKLIISARKKLFSKLFITGVLISSIISVLDIFQKVPWKPLLFSETVTYRGDYWRAGVTMGLEHPWFGVGLDQYLNHYRVSRDALTASRSVSQEVSDSAHNLFIDYFAFGGVPLLVIYILIQILVFLKIAKIIKQSTTYDSGTVSLVVAFFGFFLQSLISPVSLSIIIWSWVAIGLILGLPTVKSIIKVDMKKNKVDSAITANSNLVHKKSSVFLICAMFGVIGFVISSPFLIKDMKVRNAFKFNSTESAVYNSAYIWPKYATWMAEASWLLYYNGEVSKSLKIAQDAIKYDPNNYIAWLALYSRTDLDSAFKKVVDENILRLEPRKENIVKAKVQSNS